VAEASPAAPAHSPGRIHEANVLRRVLASAVGRLRDEHRRAVDEVERRTKEVTEVRGRLRMLEQHLRDATNRAEWLSEEIAVAEARMAEEHLIAISDVDEDDMA
jgi:chromosome segregation ATPase